MMPCAMRAVLLAAVCACGLSTASAQEPFYKGKRLTLLINFAAGGPTDIEGRLLAKHIAKHIAGQPQHHRAEPRWRRRARRHQLRRRGRTARRHDVRLLHRRGLEIRDGAGEAHGRFPHLRVHRLPARQCRLLRPQRYAARPQDRGRYPQGARPGRRRAGGRIVEGSADPRHARPAGRAAQIHHRLPLERQCAARRAARRDPPAFGIDAGLFQRGRAEPGEERHGDPALLRPQLRRR